MLNIETHLYEQLCKLRAEYNLEGIKAEFEAEGSSFRDLVRLRRLTLNAGVKLFLKIGGVEAIRDIRDAMEIGVDGIIAPMVESRFGAKKFYDSINQVYGDNKVITTLTIETRNAIEEIDDILEYAENKFDNITIGRSDLSASYFNINVTPDSDFLFDHIEDVARKANKLNLCCAVGGSFSQATIEKIKTRDKVIIGMVKKYETRKVIMSSGSFLGLDHSINEALKFEKLYILSKQEFSDSKINPEIERLTELQRRG